ncbi:hypothetical protein MTR_2g104065 [Medicago truncatula]|uniref:Uncharacterized protein n=1 Tax=Medicago truncatula TaxID=3880 RepID=A0A072VCS6_MEDTR|nr:hypothetical protein MTR_2g104065 [Medicago truncatula]
MEVRLQQNATVNDEGGVPTMAEPIGLGNALVIHTKSLCGWLLSNDFTLKKYVLPLKNQELTLKEQLGYLIIIVGDIALSPLKHCISRWFSGRWY